MYDYFAYSRILRLIEKYPREAIAGFTVIVSTTAISTALAEKVKADASVEAEKIKRECELIRLATAKVEAMGKNPPQM